MYCMNNLSFQRQVHFWAHMLDEAFEKDNEVRELSDNEVSQCIRDGVPSKMRAYDMFKCKSGGLDFLVAGWKDFPRGWFCVINVYDLDSNGKWKVITSDIERFMPDDADRKLRDSLGEVFNELSKKYDVWMPDECGAKASFAKQLFKDVKWDSWYASSDSFKLDRKVCNGEGIDINGIDFECIGQDEDNYIGVTWYQRKGVDSKPVERLLAQKMKNAIDSKRKTVSKSFFAAWQQESGHSFNDICKQMGQKLDKRVEEVFGIQEVVKFSCNCISSLLHDERLSDVNADDNYSKYHVSLELRDAFSAQFDVSKLVDRHFWWDLISDQVYRAMVSRAAHPEKSRGVSLKVIRECLGKICFDVSQLYVQSSTTKYSKFLIANSKTLSLILENFKGDAKAKFLLHSIMSELLMGAGSYVDKTTFKYDTNDDDDEFFSPYGDTSENETFAAVFKQLNKIRANESDEQFLIAQISKIVDWFHIRGSLAGVFIEGGAKTCSEVSNMKPDEMHESASSTESWYEQLDPVSLDKTYMPAILHGWNNVAKDFSKFLANCIEYGTDDSENGWIFPDGCIVGVDFHRDLVIDYDVMKNLPRVKEFAKHYSVDDLQDPEFMDDEPILLFDLMNNSFIRFSIKNRTCAIGHYLTRAAFEQLYDLEDAVCNDIDSIEDDCNGDFEFMIDIGQGIDRNGRIVSVPSFSKTYHSIDEFRKTFINDVKNHVDIVNA